MQARGSCFCGKVQYQITEHIGIFQYCHCSRCRKFTGSAHSANLMVNPQQFAWLKGEQYVKRHIPTETKHFTTCFCTECGSSLPWLAKTEKVIVIPMGTLDDSIDIIPTQNIFWASKACWYTGTNQLPKHDTLPTK